MVEVVIPYAGDCPHRARALEWVRGRYPWPVTVARTTGLWCKAAAVMPAVRDSCADVVLVADADVWTDGVHDAVAEVEAGAPWAIPHRGVHRLDEHGTAAVMAGEPWQDQPLAERAYLGVMGGGIVIAPREMLLSVPLDPRYIGWGQEDVSWAIALETLAGRPWRGRAPLVHLWHPPQDRMTRRFGSRASRDLYRRYQAASHDPTAMRALIQEAADDRRSHHHPVHAPAA
jgi:hypothetical protein